MISLNRYIKLKERSIENFKRCEYYSDLSDPQKGNSKYKLYTVVIPVFNKSKRK